MRALLLAAPLLLANVDDQTIPAPVRAMLDAAMASGNEGEVATIVKYAKASSPESADAITRIADAWRNARREASTRKIREADFLDLVKGRAEVGAYYSTGNTDNVGLTAALELRREALEWRHKLIARVEYQESLGQVTQERYLAAYEPNWKFDERAYLYGAAQYERNRFQGFYDRYSISSGIGYTALRSDAVKLDVELGPAYRNTRYIDGNLESNAAVRGKVDFDWKIGPRVTFSQDASAYLQNANSTVSSKTALATRLFGPLSAQLSYTLQFESMPAAGRESTDTTSRAALVMDF